MQKANGGDCVFAYKMIGWPNGRKYGWMLEDACKPKYPKIYKTMKHDKGTIVLDLKAI